MRWPWDTMLTKGRNAEVGIQLPKKVLSFHGIYLLGRSYRVLLQAMSLERERGSWRLST